VPEEHEKEHLWDCLDLGKWEVCSLGRTLTDLRYSEKIVAVCQRHDVRAGGADARSLWSF